MTKRRSSTVITRLTVSKSSSSWGVFLRPIQREAMRKYPIGVGMKQAGEILVADKDNHFKLTVFSQDGQPINAVESKVKDGQSFNVAVMDEGCIVVASKDYRQ